MDNMETEWIWIEFEVQFPKITESSGGFRISSEDAAPNEKPAESDEYTVLADRMVQMHVQAYADMISGLG